MVYVCSNKECRAIYDFELQGPCPTCISPKDSWSAYGVEPKSVDVVISELLIKLSDALMAEQK